MKLYHQCGHNTVWNISSLKDGYGGALILSPLHYSSERTVRLPASERKRSLFDPQFYVPDSQKDKLHSYDFFPEKIMNGFSTREYEAVSAKVAELCIDYQMKRDFEAVVIPARYFDDMVTDYIEKQDKFSIEPFLSHLSRIKCEKPVFMTLPLTSGMIGDPSYRTRLLNWITKYPEISGVYLLVNFGETGKQICDFTKLDNYMKFCRDLDGADLKVICGYCNTEGLLYAALGVHAVTMGAYENTRRFSIDKFLEDDEKKWGPVPRIYMPKLLNWIRYETADEIRIDHPDVWDRIYVSTTYSEEVFEAGNPHFTQPGLYHHHFATINKQYTQMNAIASVKDRFLHLQKLVTDAHQLYRLINEAGVMFFDSNCEGVHLPVWNRIIGGILKNL